jgi:hypothetical protein
VVTPGELFHVELTVAWWMAAPVERVELVLLLPQGITTPEGATGAVRQSVPPLGYGEYFTNTVALVSTLDAVPTPRVVTLRGGLVCAGCQEIWIERTLGVGVAPVSDGAAPAGGDAARSSLWVDARGGVLQAAGGATT